MKSEKWEATTETDNLNDPIIDYVEELIQNLYTTPTGLTRMTDLFIIGMEQKK